MSYSPVVSGPVIVEVPRREYDILIRDSEKLAILKRVVEKDYATISDIRCILGNERKENENES